MKIRYIPPSPKYDTVEHVRNDVGATLISAGFAELVPIPDRNKPDPTNAWLRHIQEEDRNRVASSYDTVTAIPGTISWGVKSLQSGTVVVIKQVGSDTFFLDGVPPDAPQSIRQQFLDAAAVNPEANRIAIEAAKQAQKEQEHKDKWEGRRQVMAAMFGSKPL